jgi:hypothetical protein
MPSWLSTGFAACSMWRRTSSLVCTSRPMANRSEWIRRIFSPLQLSQKFRWIHSARVDEALVTTELYLDASCVKSTLLTSSLALVCEMPKSPSN